MSELTRMLRTMLRGDPKAGKELEAARFVELRYFAAMTHREAAEAIETPCSAAEGLWAYARARLLAETGREPKSRV